ncbi:MAG: FAD-dependent oxidoreductase [Deltaproteobacteria bacterium]
MKNYGVIVIGGGSAGLNVSAVSAKFGLDVALIEKDKLGGDCLYYGCLPGKTLIRSAKVTSLIKRARDSNITQLPSTATKIHLNLKSELKQCSRTRINQSIFLYYPRSYI